METKLKLYGDYLNQDTRSLYVLLKESGVDFDFVLVDTLKDEQNSEQFS